MQEGTVKFFNATKGFGFIKPDNGSADIFVHVTGLIDEIHENDRVTFEVENGKKGLKTIKFKLHKIKKIILLFQNHQQSHI